MIVLAIESSCDETGVAIVEDGYRVLASEVISQVPLHERFGGVVPEIASRAHTQVITRLIERALAAAGIDHDDAPRRLDLIAVANRPGLIGALLVGVTAAKSLALAWGLPLVGVDHVHAHIASVILRTPPPKTPPERAEFFPAVSLVVSGGHTTLYWSEDFARHRVLGATTDDAAGEAFDKVAALLGLGYPGGPAVSAAAAEGDPKALRFPRTLLGKDSLDFSFSGLKTSVRYRVKGQDAARDAPFLPGVSVPDVAASFEAAVVDVLLAKLLRGLRQRGARRAIVAGGVAANRALRAGLTGLGQRDEIEVLYPELAYCTDNAAMIGVLGYFLYQDGVRDDLSLDAHAMTTS